MLKIQLYSIEIISICKTKNQKRRYSMQEMLYRVCWNTNGWQRPTGSANDSGYPGKNGFGHEEWNFCFEDAFNDYIYAFLYFKPTIRI